MIRYLLIITSFVFLGCSSKNKKIESVAIKDVSILDDTLDYVLSTSIKSSCSNIIFSDSLWLLWNKSSCEYLLTKINQDNDSCLHRPYKEFQHGENYRLEFSKVINRLGLLDKDDLKSDYYIIEMQRSGSVVSTLNYLIREQNNKINIKQLRFSNTNATWILEKEIEINKSMFFQFYEKLKVCNKIDNNFNMVYFNVTKFSPNKVEGDLSYCIFCNNSIEAFEKLIGLH